MRLSWFIALCALAAALNVGCQPAAEEAAAPAEEAAEPAMSDEDMLEAQTDAFADHWANADAAGIAGLFTDDADNVGPDGVRIEGKAAIQARYEELFSGMYQGTTVDIQQSSVKFAGPDTAIVNGTYEISGIAGAESSVKGAYTNVAVKTGGMWKLHGIRAMLNAPIPGQ